MNEMLKQLWSLQTFNQFKLEATKLTMSFVMVIKTQTPNVKITKYKPNQDLKGNINYKIPSQSRNSGPQ